MQKKKRILLLRREMERARAGGGDGQGGFLRRLVNSVVRPGQSRTPAELILSLQAEVGPGFPAPDQGAWQVVFCCTDSVSVSQRFATYRI